MKTTLSTRRVYSSQSIRIAPARDGAQAAFMWKLWCSGDELYASSRKSTDMLRISVHKLGQIHIYLGKGRREMMLPWRPEEASSWQHAFQLRFLLSSDSMLPPQESMKADKRGGTIIIDVPEGAMMLLDLWVTSSIEARIDLLPVEKRHVFWQPKLRGQIKAIVTCQIVDMDEPSREELRFRRNEGGAKITFDGIPNQFPYVELVRFSGSTTHNILLLVPLGTECFTQ